MVCGQQQQQQQQALTQMGGGSRRRKRGTKRRRSRASRKTCRHGRRHACRCPGGCTRSTCPCYKGSKRGCSNKCRGRGCHC